jgi:apolipoprotein N-acyltransferase
MDALPKLIARLETGKLAFIAFLAGALSVLAMAPFFLWPVMFVTFPVLVWVLDAVCFREPAAPQRHSGEGVCEKIAATGFGEDSAASSRRRESISDAGTSSNMGPRLRGEDAADPNDRHFQSLRREKLWRRAGFIGWAFGFGYFLASIYWIGYAFFVDAERYAILMPFAVAALPAGLALFYAAAAVLAAALWRRGYARFFAFAFAFFCAEVARGYLFTGFPWNLFGEALAANDAHMQMAAYIGVYGLTLAALFIFPVPAALISAPESRYAKHGMPLVLAVAALLASYAFGSHRLQQDAGEVEGVRLRIVQPNIPQREKWKPENKAWIFSRILSLSQNGTSGEDVSAFTHVIWPESSVPFLFGFNRDMYDPDAKRILAELIPPHTTFILGAERAEGILSVDTRYTFTKVYNSLFVLSQGAKIDEIYDKIHLVPFGEYVPLGNFLTVVGMRAFSHRLNGFEPGAGPALPVKTARAPAFLPLICYEIIFPGRVADGQERPGWFVNVTNDAWFGDSTGPHQHLHQARIRAAEEGLPVVRAANTGMSAVIDPFGRVVAKLGLGETGVIDHKLPQALPKTFYEKTGTFMLIILLLFPLAGYFIVVAGKKAG